MDSHSTRKVEKWKLSCLHPHPKQSCLFRSRSSEETQELAANMQRNGQLHSIEALPDGTILAGHGRLKAAQLLGWEEVTVWVRDDLAGKPLEAERRLVDDNLGRRQMGPLEIARCYRHLKLITKRSCGSGLAAHEELELRDQIGKRLQLSGRTLDRYLRVLEGTPAEVQDAVAVGTLPVTLAERVAGLTTKQREQIAEEIRGGGMPAEVVRRFLASQQGRHKHAGSALGAFSKALQRGIADLQGRVEKVGRIAPEERDTLEQARELIQLLLRQAEQQLSETPTMVDSLADLLAARDAVPTMSEG
jgi:ParB-like chromosome segregation protein Spo0J